jgi:mRNA m6A methyltransferase catalytic subunit
MLKCYTEKIDFIVVFTEIFHFNNEWMLQICFGVQMYAMLERISPRTRKLELFARMHNTQAGCALLLASFLPLNFWSMQRDVAYVLSTYPFFFIRWLSLGNQLNRVRLVDEGLRARYKAAYPDVEVQPPSPPRTSAPMDVDQSNSQKPAVSDGGERPA